MYIQNDKKITIALSLGIFGEISGPKHEGEQTNLIDLEVIKKEEYTDVLLRESKT